MLALISRGHGLLAMPIVILLATRVWHWYTGDLLCSLQACLTALRRPLEKFDKGDNHIAKVVVISLSSKYLVPAASIRCVFAAADCNSIPANRHNGQKGIHFQHG